MLHNQAIGRLFSYYHVRSVGENGVCGGLFFFFFFALDISDIYPVHIFLIIFERAGGGESREGRKEGRKDRGFMQLLFEGRFNVIRGPFEKNLL